MRTLAVGDIHGCRRALESLADFAGFADGDRIITLGDYADHGPDTRGAIDFLLELRSTCTLIPLRGNHDVMMLRARESAKQRRRWLDHGGDATLESYRADSLDAIPRRHWQFLESTRPHFETDTHLFVHANAYPDLPLDQQPDHMLFWERFDKPAPHASGKTMVCGHTSQKSGLPVNLGHAICIDTRAYGKGWLTCLDVDSGRYWQTNEARQQRSNHIDLLLDTPSDT